MEIYYYILNNSILREIFLYITVSGVLQILIYILCVFLLFFLKLAIKFENIKRKIAKIGLFNVIFLIFGSFGNVIWMKNIYGFYYKSQDTLVDFFPYIPFGQWVLNQFFIDPNIRGVLIADTTLLKMRGIWFIFAITVWVFSIVVTFYIIRLKNINKGPIDSFLHQ